MTIKGKKWHLKDKLTYLRYLKIHKDWKLSEIFWIYPLWLPRYFIVQSTATVADLVIYAFDCSIILKDWVCFCQRDHTYSAKTNVSLKWTWRVKYIRQNTTASQGIRILRSFISYSRKLAFYSLDLLHMKLNVSSFSLCQYW